MKRSEAVKLLYGIIRLGMASDHRVEVAYSNILQDIEDRIGMKPPIIGYNVNNIPIRAWELEDEEK